MLLSVMQNILSGAMFIFKYAAESVSLFPNPQYMGFFELGKTSLRLANILVFK
jgi:hypothetical protein